MSRLHSVPHAVYALGMNFNEIMERVRALGDRDLRALSLRSGVPWGTLAKIRYNQTDNPRIKTVEKIAACLPDVEEATPTVTVEQ